MHPIDIIQWGLILLSGIYAWRANRRSDNDSTRDDFDSLRDELRKQLGDARAEVAELRTEVEVIRGQMGTLRTRLHLAYDYIRILVAALARADVPIPGPPTGLDIDLRIGMEIEGPTNGV